MKRLFILVLIFLAGCTMTGNITPAAVVDFEQHKHSLPPTNLMPPVGLADFGTGSAFFSPYGVVRKSLDMPAIGHGGIDIPSKKGSSIYAVADGVIVGNALASDNRGGNNVMLLIAEGVRPGEGWIFLYEHITLDEDLEVGSIVTQGQQIGTNAMDWGNNHFEYSYYFHNLEFSMEPQCWIDYLIPSYRDAYLTKFNEIATQEWFYSLWYNAVDEGKYPLRGLLDPEEYPDGPRLCYPKGTDVRIDVEPLLLG